MRNALNNPWAVAVLFVIAIGILYLNGLIPSFEESVEVPMVSSKPVPAMKTNSAEVPSSKIDYDRIGWSQSIKRDPFSPVSKPSAVRPTSVSQAQNHLPNASIAQLPVLHLDAVAVEPGQQMAMINKTIVTEGDRIEGYRVIHIQSNGVLLEGPRGRVHLKFEEAGGTREIS